MNRKENQKNKKGISLIVLVITIIVIIILSVAVILSISNNNPIENARKARDVWNDRAFEEYLTLLLSDSMINGTNKNLVDYLNSKVPSEIDAVMSEPDGLVTVIKGNSAAIIDSKYSKTIGIISKDLIDEVAKMKAEFESAKSTIVENPPIKDSEVIKKYVPSYSSDSYSFRVTVGDNKKSEILVCEDKAPMTKEKILACEANGIYLLADTNKNYEVDDGDLDLIGDCIAGRVTKDKLTIREKIVTDTDSSGGYGSGDFNYIWNILTAKYNPYILKVKEEFDQKIATESNKENITLKNYNEVMEYIPSHKDPSYKFWIIRGNLVCAPNSGMTTYRIGLCDTAKIYLLGDLTNDKLLTDWDIEELEFYIENPNRMSEKQRIAADINGDGLVNNADLEELKKLVNK